MKTISKICISLFCIFIFTGIIKAEGIDQCNQENYGNESCNYTFWSPLHLFDNARLTCGNEKPSRGYEAIDPNGNVAYVACYMTDKAYVFKSYEYNENTKKCEVVLADAIKYDDDVSYRLAIKYDNSWERSSKSCPKYFGDSKKDELFYMNQYRFTNDFNTIDREENNVGQTTVDVQALERISTCITNNTKDIGCDEDISQTSSEIIDSCLASQSEFKESYKDELAKNYKAQVESRLTTLATQKAEYCVWNKECGVDERGYKEYKTAASNNTNINIDSFFSDEVASCIKKNNPDIEKIQEEITETIEGEMEDYLEESIKHNNEIYAGGNSEVSLPTLDFGTDVVECDQVLGPTITKLIRILIDVLKVAGGIICMVKMMLTLIPAITSKDAEALNKAIRTCVILLVILAVVLLIDTVIVIIGRLFAFDLSCFK